MNGAMINNLLVLILIYNTIIIVSTVTENQKSENSLQYQLSVDLRNCCLGLANNRLLLGKINPEIHISG